MARQDLDSFGEQICIFGRKLHTVKGSAFIEEWLGKPEADRNRQDYGRFQQMLRSTIESAHRKS